MSHTHEDEKVLDAQPQIHTFVLGPFQTNCFVVQPSADEQRCWIVDCGYDPEEMLDFIEASQLKPQGILLTHCHSDHIAGLKEAYRRFGPLPTYMHEAEQGFCTDPMLNLSARLGQPVTAPEPDHLLADGDTLSLGEGAWRVIHAPGHSPGCVIYVHDQSKQVLAGDTLFAGSIGRIDFPTSSPEDMRRTIHEVMMKLPDDMTIHPGHGPSTTIGTERRTNPFVRGDF